MEKSPQASSTLHILSMRWSMAPEILRMVCSEEETSTGGADGGGFSAVSLISTVG